MKRKVTIEKFTRTVEELELLKQGEKESFQINLPMISYDKRYQRLRIEDFCTEKYQLYFLNCEGKKIGYIVLQIDFASRHAWVNSLFVIKSCRGHGFAKLLLNELKMDESISKISLQVVPDNKAALSLYKNLGFEITGYQMEYKNDSKK